MSTTTMGVKLNEITRERIKRAAQQMDRTTHWFIKQAIFNYLEHCEIAVDRSVIPALAAASQAETNDIMPPACKSHISLSSILLSTFCRSR